MNHRLIQNSPTQMRKLKPRDIQWLVQSHMPSLMERQSWNPGFLAVRAMFLLYRCAGSMGHGLLLKENGAGGFLRCPLSFLPPWSEWGGPCEVGGSRCAFNGGCFLQSWKEIGGGCGLYSKVIRVTGCGSRSRPEFAGGRGPSGVLWVLSPV